MSAGPGQYNQDSALKQTHYRSREAHIDPSSPQRPTTFASQSHVGSAGPGHYTSGKSFGKDNGKTYSIGVKREKQIIASAGPG